MKVKLTPSEAEILVHRLGVDDALAECLDGQFEYQDVVTVATAYRRQIEQGELELEIASPVQMAVIADCVDGSTYTVWDDAMSEVACGQMTKGKYMSMHKAAQSVEKKLNDAGIKCQFPNH